MNKPKVCVVGSYAAGLTMKTDRFPIGGETLIGHSFKSMHGGKGSNQAVECARLGAQVELIACVGDDNFGHSALQLYKDENVGCSNVKISDTLPTGVGFIIVDSTAQNEIIIDFGANKELSGDYIRGVSDVIASSDVLLMQFEVPLEPIVTAAEIAAKSNVKAILNPAPYQPIPEKLYSLIDLATPNQTEARLMLGMAADEKIESIKLCTLLGEKIPSLIVTLGEQGVIIVENNKCELIPAFNAECVDTTGAGDTFVAALGVALSEGATLKEAAIFANAAASITVTKYGVIEAMPYRSAVDEFLMNHKKTGSGLRQ